VLNPNNDRHGVAAFLEQLATLIYARIERYIEALRCSIADAFGRRASASNLAVRAVPLVDERLRELLSHAALPHARLLLSLDMTRLGTVRDVNRVEQVCCCRLGLCVYICVCCVDWNVVILQEQLSAPPVQFPDDVMNELQSLAGVRRLLKQDIATTQLEALEYLLTMRQLEDARSVEREGLSNIVPVGQ
jgi:hypothetical protein